MLRADHYIILLFAFVAVACGHKNDADTSKMLAVSVEPQRNILEQIAGPSFKVTTVLSRGADPETFDPATAQRLAVEEAEIFFATGVLPFEQRLGESLSSATEYVTTEGHIELLYGTHTHNHADESHGHQDAVDPHYWNSLEGLKTMSDVMAQTLIRHYPDSADVIAARKEKLVAKIDSVEQSVAARLAGCKHRTFAVWHPSLSYFAREFDLEQLSLGTEGKDLSAKALAEAIDHARADSVKVFFYQPGIDSRQAEVMSKGIGSRLVPINTLAYDWLAQLQLITDEIARP